MEDTSARFRNVYKFVIDDEAEKERQEALDEEEQEQLIAKLHTDNLAKNKLYTKIFANLPLIAIFPYLSTLFSPATSLLSVLSISSLVTTAYILLYFPHNRTGLTLVDNINKPASPKSDEAPIPKLGAVIDQGPIELYLASMNAILVGLLVVAGFVLRSGKAFPGFGLLPAVVYAVILVAKSVMASVDVGQLEALKYGYKGA